MSSQQSPEQQGQLTEPDQILAYSSPVQQNALSPQTALSPEKKDKDRTVAEQESKFSSHGASHPNNQSTSSSVAPIMRREEIDMQVSELGALSDGYRDLMVQLKLRLKQELIQNVNEAVQHLFTSNKSILELSSNCQKGDQNISGLMRELESAPELPSFSYCAQILKTKESYAKQLGDLKEYSRGFKWRMNSKEFASLLQGGLMIPASSPQAGQNLIQSEMMPSGTQARLHMDERHQSMPQNKYEGEYPELEQSYGSYQSSKSKKALEPIKKRILPVVARPGWKPSKESNIIFLFHLRSKQRERIQTARSFLPCSASTQIQGFLVITGGWGNGKSKTETHVFNLKSKSFPFESSHMSQPRHCHAIAALSLSNVVVIGGCHDSPSNALSTCQNFSLQTNSWAMSIPPMNQKRFSSGACSFNSSWIYVFCGARGKSAGDRLGSVERLDFNQPVHQQAWEFVQMKYPSSWRRRCLIGATQITPTQIMIYGDQNEDKTNFVVNMQPERNYHEMMVIKTSRVPIINGFSEPSLFVENTLFTMEFDSNYLYWFSLNDHEWHYKGFPKIK